MDQEDTLDFKALRARFQDEELLLKQHKIRPALPEKPKVVPPPPPQSPTHQLPAGARPSLLTSIGQTMDGKMQLAPRVVFKNDKKESKMPLIQVSAKGKDKSEGKLKLGKDKTKGSKERLNDDSSDLKPKKDKKLPAAPKESTAELVPATPPPKATATKKKAFLNFKKSSKRDSLEITTDPILDAPSIYSIPGPAPLIPVPSDFGDGLPEPKISAPRALLPNFPTLPDSSTTMGSAPPFIIPPSPDLTRLPAFIPDVPAPAVEDTETPLEIETPALYISRPDSPPSVVLTPAPSHPPSPPAPAPRVHDFAAEAPTEAANIAPVETPPPVTDPLSIPSSPKTGRTISPLSALERAEDMNLGKRSPADQRIFNALEKARKKIGSPLTNHTTSSSITPPPEELPPSESPTFSLPELPPIDYEDRAGRARQPKPEQVNGIDHRLAFPVLEGISEEGSDPLPELFVVPPPPPRRVLPDPEALGPAPEKPTRPPFVNLSEYTPPPEEDDDIAVPLDFSETDTTDVPEFDGVPSAAHSPELPVSEWGNGEYTGPDTVDRQNLSEFYSNGVTAPGAELHAGPALADEYQDDPRAVAGLEAAAAANGFSASTNNNPEDLLTSATKKKGKSDVGKKRKGPPKNPYAEAAQAANDEKSKMGRFGKIDKKVVAEGPDEKELKKKEKQRLEKEKKELKERQEREKKEQKEREKKENETRKKFKITGQEDAMYQATVTVTTKGRKDDLLVGSGEVISIIRTTNCPKGKWLARDNSHNYGYIAVDHVELDIKEMLELGKRAANNHKTSGNVVEVDEVTGAGSRASNHYPMSAESFTDDSEEWTGDEDENLSPVQEPADPFAPAGHTRTLSMPDFGNKDLSIIHQHSQSDLSADGPHVQARHEALHKLATFFHSPKPVEPASSDNEPETSSIPAAALEEEEAAQVREVNETDETDFDLPEMLILPPPDLYADMTTD